MARQYFARNAALLFVALLLAACGGRGSLGDSFGSFGGSLFGRAPATVATAVEDVTPANATAGTPPPVRTTAAPARRGLFGLGLLGGRRAVDPNAAIQVNKYIWAAALDVLNFLPVQSADPFTGVIVTGFGTPPGGGRAYRATIFIQDPALDARSLNIALITRAGPASADTVRALEDAILTRARQIRLGDARL